MKNIIYKLWYTVLVAILFTGCDDLYDETDGYAPSALLRYLHTSKISFEYEKSSAHQIEFTVEALETQWEFSNGNDWISLSPQTGKETTTVTMNIQENPSGDESRIGFFELRSLETDWTYSKTLCVSQMASTPYLEVEKDYVSLGGDGEEKEVSITSNCNWAASSPYWINVRKDATGNKLYISASPNADKYSRSGIVTIVYKNESKYINVYQYPSTIKASDASLSFENSASEVALSLTAEADWTSSASDSWISVNPSRGNAGTHEVKISVAPNTTVSDRKGYVSFLTSGNEKAQIEIEQRGLYLKTDINVLEFSTSREETLPLKVISNTSWKVESYPVWLSLSVLSGAGNATIEITTNDNPIVDSRSGSIVLTQEGLDLSCEIAVMQVGKAFELSALYMEFPHYASSQTLKLRSELPWTSFINGEWLSTNRQSGTTDTDVTVSVLENNSYDEREGNVTYMVDGKSMVLSVHQQPKYFIIEDKVFDFTSNGGKVNISFSTNEKWTATIENEQDWLSLSQTSGEGDGNITLSVGDNPSVNSRSAVVVIDTGIGHTYRIPVSQSARYLKVDTQSLGFFAYGGSQNIIVNTDGDYKITVSDSWITIDDSITGMMNVTVSMNQEEEARRGTVSIELTDLTEGSLTIVIPVIQLGQGASFIKEEYPIDKDWNISEKHGFELSITGFTTDKDWSSSSTSIVNLIKTGYREETDWNPSSDKTGEFSKDGYENETNWENSSEQSATVGKSNYKDDKDWNSSSDKIGVISKDSYGNESNWDTSSEQSATIGKNNYEDDKDWNSSSDKIGTISKDNYGNDADWSLPANQGVTISKTNYEDDKNWNN